MGLKSIVMSFRQKNGKKFFFCHYNLSGIKLYIGVTRHEKINRNHQTLKILMVPILCHSKN